MDKPRYSLISRGPSRVCSDGVDIRENNVRASCILLEVVILAVKAE